MEERYLEGADGHSIFFRYWPADNPKGTFHINHGMAEHSARYNSFAEYLNKLGFSVYAQDHRGHGFTMSEGEKGWFSDNDGWKKVLDDAYSLDKLIASENPGLPHILFGHSMGSFIARCTLSAHSDAFDAAVICGTGASQGIVGRIGMMIASHNAKKKGRNPDPMMDKLAFSSYNKRFRGEGDFAWVTADPEERRKYIEDPLCGFICTPSFYRDLIMLSTMANGRNEAKRIRKDIPILLISGDADPVGGYGKGVAKVMKLYKDAGIRDVRMVLYPHGRHEILNESERDDAMKAIADFIKETIGDERR